NRYTGRLSRMDRIVVFLKKSGWAQVFSGYLTQVPAWHLVPTTCTIKGVCTIKRLMHTYWDPGLPDSAQLLVQRELGESDSGMGKTIIRLLSEVAGWDKRQIHIQ